MKKTLFLAVLTMLLALVMGCTSSSSKTPLQDDLGRAINIKGVPQKIVSLAPSNTEILFALGAGNKVVAVDTYSDYPAEAANLPKVGAPFPGFSIETIASLKPDLAIAFGYELPDYATKLESLGIPVVVLAPKDIDGIMKDVTLIGKITGAEDQAKKITSEMKKRVDAVTAKTKGVRQPRVFWEFDASDPSKPWTAGPGSFNDALIALAGGRNIAAGGPKSAWQMNAEQIVTSDPEIIILGDYQFGTTVESVLQRPGWGPITAIKNKAIFPIENPGLTDRPTPRIVDGLELLAKIIHPELFK